MPKIRPVIATTENGRDIHFRSVTEAALAMTVTPGRIVASIVMGQKCRGFFWRYDDANDE